METPEHHSNNNHKFALGAALALFGTALVTFVPVILQMVQHWESKEQRELTKELTRLQVEEKKMQNARLKSDMYKNASGFPQSKNSDRNAPGHRG